MGQGHAAIGRGGAAKTLATRELLREIRRAARLAGERIRPNRYRAFFVKPTWVFSGVPSQSMALAWTGHITNHAGEWCQRARKRVIVRYRVKTFGVHTPKKLTSKA
jgi:hypothetical protein